jgi:hypothetical protein
MRLQAAILGIVLATVVPLGAAQHGALTSPRNLVELTERADLIVQARVVSAAAEPHPKYANLMTVLVTVAVQDTLKGSSPRIHVFRQFVWDERDRRTSLGYRKGQEVLLLLNRENEHGLTSPVGLEQGRFRIDRGADGQAVALNGQGNHGLFDGVADRAKATGVRLSERAQKIASGRETGAVPLEDLKEMIRGFVRPQ